MTTIRNTDGSYMSPDQIVRDLHTGVTDEKTLEWLKGGMKPLDGESPMLAAYERGAFMRWLRNSYGLWEKDNPYVCINAPASDFTGVQEFPLFPDNLSQAIVERFVKELNERASMVDFEMQLAHNVRATKMLPTWVSFSYTIKGQCLTHSGTFYREPVSLQELQDEPSPVTMTCRLDDEQVAKLRNYAGEKTGSLKPQSMVVNRLSINVADSASFRASSLQIDRALERSGNGMSTKKIPDADRAPPPTYVRMGVTDPVVCYRCEVFLDGVKIGNAIGADSKLGYVLTIGFDESMRGLAFGRKNGDVEIRWAS